jgi:hypothetical protein
MLGGRRFAIDPANESGDARGDRQREIHRAPSHVLTKPAPVGFAMTDERRGGGGMAGHPLGTQIETDSGLPENDRCPKSNLCDRRKRGRRD